MAQLQKIKVETIRTSIIGQTMKIEFIIMKSNLGEDVVERLDVFSPYVYMKFKFSNWDSIIKSSISFQKTSSLDTTNIQITVTVNIEDNCKQHVISQFSLSGDWSEYFDLGCLYTGFGNRDLMIFPIIANIRVHIMNPGPGRILYEDNDYCDFHLSTEDGSVPVHRVVMAGHSEVFKTMLSREWKETAKGCLEVKGITQQTLQHLKDYMYLGLLPEHDDLRPLLLIAKCYMMRYLEAACADQLVTTVKPEKLLDLHKFALDNHLSELIFSMMQLTSNEVIHSARKAITQKPKLEEDDK